MWILFEREHKFWLKKRDQTALGLEDSGLRGQSESLVSVGSASPPGQGGGTAQGIMDRETNRLQHPPLQSQEVCEERDSNFSVHVFRFFLFKWMRVLGGCQSAILFLFPMPPRIMCVGGMWVVCGW